MLLNLLVELPTANVVKLLLERRAEVSSRCIAQAKAKGHAEVVALLMQHG